MEVSIKAGGTGMDGVHGVVGEEVLVEMGAPHSKDTHTSTDVGIGVSGLVEVGSAMDGAHIDIEVLIARREIDIDILQILLGIGVVLEGSLYRVEERLKSVFGRERRHAVTEEVDMECVAEFTVIETHKRLVAAGMFESIPRNLADTVDKTETLVVGRGIDEGCFSLEDQRDGVGTGDKAVIVDMTHLQLIHTGGVE